MESRRIKWTIAIVAISLFAGALWLGLGTWRAPATLNSPPEAARVASDPRQTPVQDSSGATALRETPNQDDRAAQVVDPPPAAIPPPPKEESQHDGPAHAENAGPAAGEIGEPAASRAPDGGTHAHRCTRRLEKLGNYPGFKVPVRINGTPLVLAWDPDEPLDTSFIEPETVMRLGLAPPALSATIAHARPLRVKPDLVEPASARVERVEMDGRATGPLWLGVAKFALVFLGADGQLGRDLTDRLGLTLGLTETGDGQLRYQNCTEP